jgi:hypothetical protein
MMLTNKYFRATLDDEHERIREEESLALYLINIQLEQSSQPPNIKNLSTFGLPWPHINFDDVLPGENRLLHEERQNAVTPLYAEQLWQLLNAEQLTASTAIAEAVDSGDGGVFFLEGCGGSGKIFAEAYRKDSSFGTIFGFSD